MELLFPHNIIVLTYNLFDNLYLHLYYKMVPNNLFCFLKTIDFSGKIE